MYMIRTFLSLVLNPKKKRILVYGDSNTCRPNKGSRWTDILSKRAPKDMHVINWGCDGRTTVFDLGRLNGLTLLQANRKQIANVDFFIVMLGTNDVKQCYGPPTSEAIVEGMKKIIDEAKAYSKAQIILLTPPPMAGVYSGEFCDGNKRVLSLAEQYRTFAAKEGIELIDIFYILDSNSDLEADGVHINDNGRKKIADAVWASIETRASIFYQHT